MYGGARSGEGSEAFQGFLQTKDDVSGVAVIDVPDSKLEVDYTGKNKCNSKTLAVFIAVLDLLIEKDALPESAAFIINYQLSRSIAMALVRTLCTRKGVREGA